MRRLAQMLLPTGTLALVLVLGVVHANFRGLRYSFGSQNSLGAYVFFAVVFIAVALAIGVLDEPRTVAQATVTTTLAALISIGIVAVVQLFRPGLLPRFVLTAAAPTLSAWALVCCLVARSGQRRRRLRDRVIAVVTEEEAGLLLSESSSSFPLPEQVFTLTEVVELLASLPPDNTLLLEAARSSQATVVVLTDAAQRNASIVQQAAVLHDEGCRIRTIEGFYDQWLGKLPLSSLDRMALLTDIGEVHGGGYANIKRLWDVLAGLFIGVACVVLTPVVAVGNLIANRGSLLYRQPRVGLRGEVFTVLKFRTMRPCDLEPDTLWTSIDDPRITPFGRLLRRTHVDELPQFWNMLRGDLSLVGPRPEQPHYVAELRRKLPFYDLRHSVQPGLTGWAQVKFRYAASEADAFEKLQYDLFYLRHQSVSLDARVLARTVRSILRGHGR